MKNPARTSVIVRVLEKQNQQLGDDQSNTDARGPFHDLPAKDGIVVGKLWAFLHRLRRRWRGQRRGTRGGDAAQIEQPAANPDLDDDVSPENFRVMHMADGRPIAAPQTELALINDEGRKSEERKTDDPEYGRAIHGINCRSRRSTQQRGSTCVGNPSG